MPKESHIDRFYNSINKNGPIPFHSPDLRQCWLWTKSLNKKGYGQFWNGFRVMGAHLFSLGLKIGRALDYSSGEQPCHHCDNNSCVNPDHLYLGDNTTNQQDAVLRGTWSNGNCKKKYCKRGHEFTAENTRINPRGQRVCRNCDKLLAKQYRDRKKL